jgi:hypothetical protein
MYSIVLNPFYDMRNPFETHRNLRTMEALRLPHQPNRGVHDHVQMSHCNGGFQSEMMMMLEGFRYSKHCAGINKGAQDKLTLHKSYTTHFCNTVP